MIRRTDPSRAERAPARSPAGRRSAAGSTSRTAEPPFPFAGFRAGRVRDRETGEGHLHCGGGAFDVPAGPHRTVRHPGSAPACARRPTRRPTDPGRLHRMLTVLCRNAEVRRVRVHDLRHTCGSLLLAQGVDAWTIMETLGRSTTTMTLDTYAHVRETTLTAAADQKNDALGGDDEGGPTGGPAVV
ncbi:tyrosine-type recombinase/integrase [Streptomyces sp. DSM 42041]|uniref:Tyrosine-type recombinase/integrase n=1 Tax=Streptomyces hazeniae TaxID=3075538 RepID=A0ABU2NPF8_9ACTN|nr:tyrosine-type recombinase/integrase [Streptomyces sp. DSM 42041]MDT0378853.1 tyrosine-type recombinase/integrase [Streptomyces sp. DSM 42041]